MKDELKCIRKEECLVDPDVCIKLLVQIVVTNVKYHLGQLKNDQSIVENAFQSTDLQVGDRNEEDTDLVGNVILEDLEKCIRLFVVTVVKFVKYLLNPLREDQSIVDNAWKNINLLEGTDEKKYNI